MIRIQELISDLDFHGITHEIDNWYSVSGPGDISLFAHHDGFRVTAVGFDDEPDTYHENIDQAIKEISRLSDRAWNEDF